MKELTKSQQRWLRGKGIRSATHVPAFILKMKGRKDAEKGSTVADTYVSKVLNQLAAIEAKEVITAETILDPVRKKAVYSLKMLQDYPAGDPRHTRAEKSIADISEEIKAVETTLYERISKARKKSLAKKDGYLTGVREVLPDYKDASQLNADAITLYENSHKGLNDKVINAASAAKKEE